MKFSDNLNDGLVETLNRLCGATVNTYPFKAKAADLNDALDWYFQLAFKAGMDWEFDDINQTSPPIDTQDIVSGTNRYKVGTFTEKIINLVKLEVLDSAGKGHPLVPETFDTLGTPSLGNTSGQISGYPADSFQELYLNAPSGVPTNYVKFGDFIYLRPSPNYSYTAALKAFFNRPASKFSFVTCQPEADDDLITATAHGLLEDDTVIFQAATGGTISAGITADTIYYVIASGLTANVFKVSTTQDGSTINITSDGTGIQFLKTNKEPGIPLIHHQLLCRKSALTYLSYIASPKLGFLPQQVLLDARTVEDYFSERTKDTRKRMTTRQEDNR